MSKDETTTTTSTETPKTRKPRTAAPKAPKPAKPAKAAKPAAAKKPAKEAKATKKTKAPKGKDAVPAAFSKKEIVLEMLRRKEGATMAEIAKATDWQNHSIRGFISGNLGKKMNLSIESFKNGAGDRSYRLNS